MDRPDDPAAAHAQSVREYREWRAGLAPVPPRLKIVPTRRTPRPRQRSRLACVYCGNRARGGQLTCWLHADHA